MNHLSAARIALALAIGSLPLATLQAATVAAQAGVFTISPCPSFCGGPGGVSEFDGDGGEGFSSAYASIVNGTNGSGQARADIAGGPVPLPSLGAEAYSLPDAQVTADAGAMQKYVYHGASSAFVLDATLDGSVVNPGGPTDAALFASIGVVLAPDLGFSTDPGTFFLEIVALDPNATLLELTSIDFATLNLFNLGPQSASDSLSFTLNDGDEVFIYASMLTRGTRGASADAFSSLTLAFSGGNVAGLSAVPLPAPFLLLGAACGLLGLQRRARRVAVAGIGASPEQHA